MWTLWLLAFLPCSRAFSFPESLDLKLALNDASLSSFAGGVPCVNWNYLAPWKDNQGNYYGKLVRLKADWTTEVLDLPSHLGNAELVGFGGAVCAQGGLYLVLAPFHHGWAIRLTVGAWSTTPPTNLAHITPVDFTTTHPELTGFCSAFYWSSLVFFVPCTHGTVVKVSTSSWAIVGTLNLTARNPAWRGFTGSAWRSTNGYVVPHGLNGESSGVVVGFVMTTFTIATTFTIDVASSNAHLTGFVGGFIRPSSVSSLMMVPHDYGEAVSVNLDTRMIGTQWNLTASRSGLQGFAGGFEDSDGNVFLVPLRRKNGGYSSKVVKLLGSSDIRVMDVAKDDPDLAGFNGGFIDGAYGFLVPFRDASWPKNYYDAAYDSVSAGKIVRFPLSTTTTTTLTLTEPATTTTETTTLTISSTTGTETATSTSSTASSTSTSTATSSSTTTSSSSSTTTSSSSRSSSTRSSSTTSTSTSESSTSSSSTSSSSTVSSSSSSTSTSSSSSSSVSSSSTSSTSATTLSSTSSSSTSSSSSFSSTSTSSSTVSTSSTSSRTTSTSRSSTTSSSSTTLSSTTSSTATTITETATTHTVTSTTTVTTMLIIPAAEKAMKAEKTIKEGAESLVARSIPGMDTALGRLTIVAVADLLAEKEVPLANAMEKSGVQASREMLEELPSGSVIAMLNMPLPEDPEWRKQEPFDNVGGEKLALPVMGVTILDDHYEPVTKFKEPILIKLTEDPNATGANEAECAYLEVLSNTSVRWSTQGVRRATKAETGGKEGVWCRAEHLSLFAVLLQVALGCTNLELLTPQAISAIETHEGWWRSPPAVLFFCVATVLLTLLLLGSAVELWRMRLGQMKKPAKKVQICQSCLAFGPQLLKHRYAAFVVFAKDLLSCMAKGREKLRLPTLTAAVQRNFALEAAISNACVSQHCWSGGAWTESPAALPHAVLLHKLHFHAGGAEESIARLLRGKGPLHILRRYVITFAACHPLLDSLRLGANALTVRKRAALQVAAFLGVLATNAMIFNFSGSQRGWEADFSCPILPTSQLFIIVATVVSILLNVLPNTFLMNLAKQIYGRPRWHLVFWALTIFYLTLAAFIVIVALANLNPKDQAKWHSSMRWSLSIKLLGMPAVQALRNSILLELFLHEKGKVPPMEQLLGLAVPMEQPLSKEDQQVVDRIAARGLTSEGLVNFLSLLGDIVMPDYDMETSTSADVVEGALRSFCGRGPELAQASLDVKVLRLRGVRSKGERRLQCAVLRLGSLERGGRRACLAESRSRNVMVNPDGECPFDLEESVAGLELTGAIGFVVMENERMIGAACLSAEELVKDRGFAGELPLHALDAAAENFTSLETPLVRANAADCGVKEERCKLAQTAKMAVRVVMLPEYMQALALHELRKRELAPPGHSSEVPEASETLRREVLMQARRTKEKGASCLEGACYGEEVGSGPVEEVVVHSQQMVFLDLVAAVVAENLGGKQSCDLREALLCREFDGVLDMLRASPRRAVRYWIDMFALDVDAAAWQKELVRAAPSLLRCVKKQCCGRMAEDLRAREDMSCGLPEQLIIFDRDLCILQEAACLAQVKVANDLRFAQRVLLRPEHLHGPKLGQKLLRTGSAEPWARPLTDDSVTLTGIFVALSLKAAERQREGNETAEDLHLTDVVAAVAGARAGQRTNFDDAAGDIGAADVAADIDA